MSDKQRSRFAVEKKNQLTMKLDYFNITDEFV